MYYTSREKYHSDSAHTSSKEAMDMYFCKKMGTPRSCCLCLLVAVHGPEETTEPNVNTETCVLCADDLLI